MKKVIILLILLFLAPLHSFPFKDIFLKGNNGDFSIYQDGSLVTILSIHSIDAPYITLEEITLPKKLYKNIKGKDLNTWIKKGGKGRTSWTMIELNSETMDITSAYCFLKNKHLDLAKEDTLISSLLSLNINNVPDEERLRIGPRRPTKKDHRLFWEPSMYVNGIRKFPTKMDVYGGVWEKDASLLSGRNIDLYVLDDFPFPYWIQIHGDFGSKKMISLDSGKNLTSPITKVPRMPPRILTKLERWDDGKIFSFLVKAGRTTSDFTLYFVELAKNGNNLIPIESKYQILESNVLKFNLLKERLCTELTKGKCYRLYLSYRDGDKIKSIISKDIIHWK